MAPGEKREREGWEILAALGVTASALIIGIGKYYAPKTDLRLWAKEEALVRESLREQGVEIEYGRNYSQELYGKEFKDKFKMGSPLPEYSKPGLGALPEVTTKE